MAQQATHSPAFVTRLTPEPEKVDTNPSDQQPPGIDDEEIDLETALTTL